MHSVFKIVGTAIIITCADAYGNALARVHPSDHVRTHSPCGDSITATMPLHVNFVSNFGIVTTQQIGTGSVRMDFRRQLACYSFAGDNGVQITPKNEICLRIDMRNATASETPVTDRNTISITARLPNGDEVHVATLTRFGAERAYLFNLRRCQKAGNGLD